MNYWLLKSEPETFSIDHLAKRHQQIEPWDGVRNYQARNFLRNMQQGDLAFFYHSSCAVPGIVGIVEIVKTAYPDKTQFNPESKYYDPRSKTTNPSWSCVDVQLKSKFKTIITLTELKQQPQLEKLQLLRKGNRLSVMPITQSEWNTIIKTASN